MTFDFALILDFAARTRSKIKKTCKINVICGFFFAGLIIRRVLIFEYDFSFRALSIRFIILIFVINKLIITTSSYIYIVIAV
jgi:hypothetical protein